MTAARLSPAIALAIGFGALALASVAAFSAGPRLAAWFAPPPPEGMLSAAPTPTADLEGRLHALAANHGVDVTAVSATAAGDAIVAQIKLRGEEARMLRLLQAMEAARPAFSLREADIARAQVTPDGGTILEARLAIAARYAP